MSQQENNNKQNKITFKDSQVILQGDNVQDSSASLKTSQKNNQSPTQINTIPMISFIASCLPIYISVFYMYYFLFTDAKLLKLKSILVLVGTIITFTCQIIIMINYKVNPIKLSKLIFILDLPMMIICTSTVLYIGIVITKLQYLPSSLFLVVPQMVIFALTLIFITSAVKMNILYSVWKSWQIIFYKITLIIGGTGFFYVIDKIVVENSSFTNHQNYNLDHKLNALYIMFCVSLLELFYQLVYLVSTFDYTQNYKFDYIFRKIYRQKVSTCKTLIRQTRRNIHTFISLKMKTKNFNSDIKNRNFQNNIFDISSRKSMSEPSIHLIPVSKINYNVFGEQYEIKL